MVSLLRICNQHKMGPAGVRLLLLEMHTRKFSTLRVQYLESVFEAVARQDYDGGALKNGQTTLHNFVKVEREYPGFGDFDSPEGYGGFAPSEQYLSHMMNCAIESDELDANQHTSCLAPDQLAIDDSHKVCTFHLCFIIKLCFLIT